MVLLLNITLQALLSHGVITHAQYMNFIYMKNVINNCKTEHEGSVIAEVGSEHCNSEGHMTDSDEAMETCEEKRKSEIQVLKDCLVMITVMIITTMITVMITIMIIDHNHYPGAEGLPGVPGSCRPHPLATTSPPCRLPRENVP